jgi:SH3-like domain-containing protein
MAVLLPQLCAAAGYGTSFYGDGVYGGGAALIATTTTLTSSASTSTLGDSVTFTVTVLPADVTGTVTLNGATTLGTITLTGGIGSLTTTALLLGTQSVTAAYNGDTTYLPSTSNTLTQIVNGSSSNTATTNTGGGGGGGSRRPAVSVTSTPSVSRSSSSSRATTSSIVARSSLSAPPSSEPSAPTTPISSSPLSTLTAVSNLRASPSSTARLLVTLKPGWQVTVESVNGQWAKVRTASGKEGFVLARNVRVTPITPPPSAPLPSPASGQTRIVGTSLVLHVSPSVPSKKVTTLSPNQIVTLLSVKGDWAEVQYTWHHGWVVRKYLR